VRRIARGLYDVAGVNRLTGKPTSPDRRDVIDALTRKGKVRILVGGITAAHDLGLTDAWCKPEICVTITTTIALIQYWRIARRPICGCMQQ